MELDEILDQMCQDGFWVLYSKEEQSLWADEDYPTLFPSREVAQERIDSLPDYYQDYKPRKVLQLRIEG